MNGRSVTAPVEARVFDQLDNAEWDCLVLAHPDYNFFHCSAWARVIRQTYGHKPLYIQFAQQGDPIALVPLIEILSPLTGRRGICLPFSDACGPLVFAENRLNLILRELSKIARERSWKYFEIRGGAAFDASAEIASAFYGHKLTLSCGTEKIFEHFTSSNKRAIRRAAKNNLSVEIAQSPEAMREFYKLHVRTRRRHGAPPQPIAFFRNIQENVIRADLGFVVLARAGLQVVAAAVFFCFGGRAIYKFGASNPRFQKSRANNLVMWEAIRYLISQGSEILHFGRTSLDNQGLRQFKLSWGGAEEIIKYYRFDAIHDAWMRPGSGGSTLPTKIFRNLPLGVNRLAGAMIYPHLD